jgi:hypothetical protein
MFHKFLPLPLLFQRRLDFSGVRFSLPFLLFKGVQTFADLFVDSG